jgi:xanthine dehydrogenase molybdopterin-binding subunit B
MWRGSTGRRSLAVDYLYYDDDGKILFIDVRTTAQAGLSVPPEDR